MSEYCRGKTKGGKGVDQYWHNDQAASHTQQSGGQSRHDAEGGIDQIFH